MGRSISLGPLRSNQHRKRPIKASLGEMLVKIKGNWGGELLWQGVFSDYSAHLIPVEGQKEGKIG